MTSADLWYLNQRQNEAGQQPLANFSALMSQRSAHLADLASERSYEQGAAEAGSKRRIREYTEEERLRAMKEMADQGVPVKSDMTMDDLASAKRDFMTQRATTQLGIIQTQMGAAQSKQQQAFDAIHRIASTPTLGNKELRLAALRTALNDPSARLLPDDVRASLHAVLDRGDDPAKAMDQAVQRMQEFWGSKGVLKSTRFNNAAQFLQAYTTPLQSSASEAQKADLIGAMKMLDDSNKQVESLNQQAFSHFGANAGFLPKDAMANWSAKMGPPADPNAVMAGAGKPAAAPAPTPAPTAPQARATRPFNDTSAPPIAAPMSAWSNTGGFAGTANFTPPSVPGAPSVPSLGDLGTVIGNAFSSDRPDLPPGPQELQSFRAATIAQSPKPGVGGSVLVQATPEEKMKAENMVRAGLRTKGMSSDQINQFINDSNQKIAAGDPQAISSANQLLQMVRSAASPFGMQPSVANQ